MPGQIQGRHQRGRLDRAGIMPLASGRSDSGFSSGFAAHCALNFSIRITSSIRRSMKSSVACASRLSSPSQNSTTRRIDPRKGRAFGVPVHIVARCRPAWSRSHRLCPRSAWPHRRPYAAARTGWCPGARPLCRRPLAGAGGPHGRTLSRKRISRQVRRFAARRPSRVTALRDRPPPDRQRRAGTARGHGGINPRIADRGGECPADQPSKATWGKAASKSGPIAGQSGHSSSMTLLHARAH